MRLHSSVHAPSTPPALLPMRTPRTLLRPIQLQPILIPLLPKYLNRIGDPSWIARPLQASPSPEAAETGA
jgi:hypothetical protein